VTGIFYYDIATMQTKNEQLLHFCNKLHKLLQTVSHFSNAMFIYRKNSYAEFLLDFVYKKSLRSVNMCRMFSDSAWATISYGKKCSSSTVARRSLIVLDLGLMGLLWLVLGIQCTSD